MKEYKYKINQNALQHFFTDENITNESIKAARQVVTVVILKHYAKYIYKTEDLQSLCMVKLLDIKKNYDMSFSAYNYAYTACRNEIGNYIAKHKEVIVEDILPMSNASVNPEIATLPPEINKFKKYLIGTEDFTTIQLTRKEAIDLILFCDVHSNQRKISPPEFLMTSGKAAMLMYRLLNKI